MSPETAAPPAKETKTRTCHACGEPYEYPVMNSLATRFHCDNCVALPEAARKALTRLSTRIRKLEKSLEKIAKDSAKAA